MTKASRRQLSIAVVRSLKEQPARHHEIIKSLAAYLIENKQANQVDVLLKDIARQLQITEGIMTAEVTSAFTLPNATLDKLKNYLQTTTGVHKVDLEVKVDPELLSGMIVRTVDKELDTSARRRLRQLASLNSGGTQ